MALAPSARLANPRVSLYFGIYTSLILAVGLVALLMEQLGVAEWTTGALLFVAPVALFVVFGVAVRSQDPSDFFAAGRRVPAALAGAAMAVTALGGVGLVSLTGSLFLMGSDAFSVLLGIPAGLIIAGVLLVPFLRKLGAYTLAGHLAERLESRLVRAVAAAILAVPVLLVLVAEIQLAGVLASRLTHLSVFVSSLVLLASLGAMLVGGGVRSLAWTSTAKVIATVVALLVPVTIAGVLVSNFPLPQMTSGNVARGILRLEVQNNVPLLQASPWMVDIPGTDLEALGRRFLQMFGSVGASAFSLVMFAVATGVAGMPSVLARAQTTRSVMESRTAVAWAIVVSALLILTMAAIAIYLRAYVSEQVFAQPADRLPGWFQILMQQGIATVDAKGSVPVSLAAIRFNRDATVAALPIAIGLPKGFVMLALAGGLAACLAGAGAHLMTLATSIAEDIVIGHESTSIAAPTQLTIVRISVLVAALAGGALSLMPTDPLQLVLWALTITSAASFPILTLSILWKRLTGAGAIAGMVAGFAIAVVLIVAGQTGRLDIAVPLPAAIGCPAAFIVAIVVSLLTAPVGRHGQNLLRDMRVPGGETLMDRQRRLHRLQQGGD